VYNFFACGDQFVGCPTLAGIDIQGLLNSQQNGGGGEMLSEQQTTYLYRLCKDTEEAVEEYESSVSTTPSPTTKSPTGEPTTSPKTNAPTSSPVVSTPSPTTLPPTPTGTTSCPPQYTAGQSYAADDLVSNEVYESTQIPYFKCKPFPFAAWCSQAAYEPGVTIAWEEAWELMGVCDNSGSGGGGTTTSTTTTTSATVATTTAATTSGGTTTTTVATNPSLSTPPPSPTPTPTPPTPTTTTTIPTKPPTITNPEETPTTGPLPIQFQYEIGNNQNLQSQSILTERNPINNVMEYLESGTDSFVKVIMDATFGSGGGGSSSSSSAVGAVTKDQKADSLKVNNENVRRRRTTTRRNLAVTYNPTSVTIENIQDIACSYQNMTTESRCQKVTAGVTLQLTNEPPLTTNLRFQTGISNGIDMGLLTFPPESGIVYVGQTKSVQVIPEFGLLPDNNGSGGNKNGSGGDSNTSNDKWVVPVSVTVAASVAAILILFAGSRFRKRQWEGKEFDGAEQVSLEGDGNDVANDLSPEYNEYSYPPGSKRHMNIFEETIDETPTFNDSDSDLIDLERGGSVNNMTTMMNQSNNEQHRSTSKNPFASSSSSGSNSDDEYIQQHQPVSHGFPLPSWKEVSEDDLSKSGEVGEMYMRDRDSTDYRAAVEALVRQACPEQIDNVDDLMAEYEGRESVLIGQLSVMLATQKEADRGKAFSMEDKRKGIDEPRLKSVLESGAAMTDSKSFDESSAAGSSQWSTDDGMSSIDASMSASSSEREMLPDTYAAIGDAALITSDSNLMSTTFIKVEKNPDDEFSGLDIPGGEEKPRGQPITREDLDAAIEAGDWNAVGATAALLAGGSFDRRDSDSEYSSSQSDGGNISLSSMDYSDKDRAQEFEQLIEAGDWKAVMAIASEFEGAGESGSFQVSKLSDMEYDSSRRMSSSDVFERDDQALTKRQEIEELVRRVVPDEIENIDEMLLQFKGREDELIMTLQTMDERNQHSMQGSNSSLSSPASSKESSAESPGFQTLKQMPSFHEEHVFESDSILNESDYDTGKSSKSKTSSSNRGSDSDSSSSSEDLSNLIHR